MSMNDIQGKVNDLRSLRMMQEELEKEITAIQNEIKAHMTDTNTDEISGPDFKVTWKLITTSRLDTAGLKKAAPDLFQQFQKVSETRRFLIA